MGVLVQQPAPDFKAQAVMPNKEFKQVSLRDYKGKYVLLFFWPLDFTFVCPTEIIAFSDRNDEFAKLGVQILGVSIDSHFTHLAWRNTARTEGRPRRDRLSDGRRPEQGNLAGLRRAAARRHRPARPVPDRQGRASSATRWSTTCRWAAASTKPCGW